VAQTIASHGYERHFCASGINGVLIVPQGPDYAPSSNFGKLMDPGGLAALLQQIMVVLYREQRIVSPAVGQLVLTVHSGGYVAVADNLDPAINTVPVTMVVLFDAIYAKHDSFIDFATAGGLLRSNYVANGTTASDNEAVIAALENAGFAVATEPTQAAFRDEPIVIYETSSTHNGATRFDGAFGEQLRWAMPHHRQGPRLELRQAVVDSGTAQVSWFSPHDLHSADLARSF